MSADTRRFMPDWNTYAPQTAPLQFPTDRDVVGTFETQIRQLDEQIATLDQHRIRIVSVIPWGCNFTPIVGARLSRIWLWYMAYLIYL